MWPAQRSKCEEDCDEAGEPEMDVPSRRTKRGWTQSNQIVVYCLRALAVFQLAGAAAVCGRSAAVFRGGVCASLNL